MVDTFVDGTQSDRAYDRVDEMGRVVEIVQQRGPVDDFVPWRVQEMRYDSLDRLVRIDPVCMHYESTTRAREQQCEPPYSGEDGIVELSNGNVLHDTWHVGDWKYDAEGRLISLDLPGLDGATTFEYFWTYDGAERVASFGARIINPAKTSTCEGRYSYLWLGRLLVVQLDVDPGDPWTKVATQMYGYRL